jgi:hypothetical protein
MCFRIIILLCGKPLTGKKTLNLVSNEQLFPTSFQQYGTFLQENKVITGTTDARRVENVGVKIKLAAEKYLNYLGLKEYLNGYQWEYKLVQSPDVNVCVCLVVKLLYIQVFYQ